MDKIITMDKYNKLIVMTIAARTPKPSPPPEIPPSTFLAHPLELGS